LFEFLLLPLQALHLGLILLNLALLFLLSLFLALELIADQSARARPEHGTDGSSGPRTPYRATDNSSSGGSAERAYSGSLLPRG
jgi:hypothetical protein